MSYFMSQSVTRLYMCVCVFSQCNSIMFTLLFVLTIVTPANLAKDLAVPQLKCNIVGLCEGGNLTYSQTETKSLRQEKFGRCQSI